MNDEQRQRVRERPVFPFTALVGQDRMKQALRLNAINPKIGGVLIRGEKGTAKSTAARALAALLPEITVTAGCPYACDPAVPDPGCPHCRLESDKGRAQAKRVSSGRNTKSGSFPLQPLRRRVRLVELPVGATEDRVAGTLNLEKAIKQGESHFEPGLLAAAHRGILYIDEVNLLNDHLVDILLDAAAMGMNYVERENISFAHPAQFILIGTMNPEEGDLRPQLLDRFGLAVEVEGTPDPADRAEVVRRRIAFETDPATFLARWQAEEAAERERLARAQELLPSVRLSEEMLTLITQICADYLVDGLRADIVMYKTAATIASYTGKTDVGEDEVREAAELALLHRRRRQPFQQPDFNREQLDKTMREQTPKNKDPQGTSIQPPKRSAEVQNCVAQPRVSSELRSPTAREFRTATPPQNQQPGQGQPPVNRAAPDQVFAPDQPYRMAPITVPLTDTRKRESRGRRSKTLANSRSGYAIGATIPSGQTHDLAFAATLRAAAPHQRRRQEEARLSAAALLAQSGAGAVAAPFRIETSDLRETVRQSRMGNLILFIVDASGSMAALQRMAAAKGAALSLLLDAYQRRDRVGLIAFRGASAELLLPPTNSVDLAERCLATLPTGGRTPLSSALLLSYYTLERYLTSDRDAVPLLVLISDGRANVALDARANPFEEARQIGSQIAQRKINTLVIDTETGPVQFGLARLLSEKLQARYLRLDTLEAASLTNAVRLLRI